MALSDEIASQIVSAVTPVTKSIEGGPGSIGPYRPQAYAPAWFYSALNWLSATYLDANGNAQSFSDYLVGSDVDPYQQLGSTRLFVVARGGQGYVCSTATNVNGTAALPTGNGYPATDDGILSLYNDLAASPIFSAVTYCYVPGRSTPDEVMSTELPIIESGYDPASGLRVILQGSAVAQVVPLGYFEANHNEQVYDTDPQIVPLVSALVFDVTKVNTLNATTFVVPVYYARDQVGPDTYANRFATTTTVNGASVDCGQTALFPGGPGYLDSSATELISAGGATSVGTTSGLTAQTFATAHIVSILPIQPRIQTGVCTLTYSGTSPAAIFANQRIAGFYCESGWADTGGLPIYDYGASNSSFTNTTVPQAPPDQLYGTADEFLNGGTLQGVVEKLLGATYLMSTDQVVGLLDDAIGTRGTTNGSGLSVTTAALDFAMSPTASGVVDNLAVPLLATVTTTPNQPTLLDANQVTLSFVGTADAVEAVAARPTAASSSFRSATPIQSIGAAGNTSSPVPSGPTTVQVPLEATIPECVLAVTGITGVEIGTALPEQDLGPGATLAVSTSPTVVNLAWPTTPPLPVFTLELSTSGLDLTAGVTYTFSLTGSALSVTGSDSSSDSVTLAAGANTDTTHDFVGMAVYSTTLDSVTLYPLVSLSIPAPAVGTDGVVAGETYGITLTFGEGTSTYDVVGPDQTMLASSVSITSPAPSDGSTPGAGDLYFGSFSGGATSATVWLVPVFATVTAADFGAASLTGTLTIVGQVSGLPGYDLAITDSSLFVYSNIDVDTGSIGSVSAANVFLASAVINSSPDDDSAEAFAPSTLLMGIIRQVQMGSNLVYAFIPEDDSVVIGGIRYMLSVINLMSIGENPNALPYPPSYWPNYEFWQFANRHNPYRAVRYRGEDETDRLRLAAFDVDIIGARLRATGEPMQLNLDTGSDGMVVWPIYAFPYTTATESVDLGLLKSLTGSILDLINTEFPSRSVPSASELGEQIVLPTALDQDNPYTFGVTASTNPTGTSPVVAPATPPAAPAGQAVTNLSPGAPSTSATTSPDEVAETKAEMPALEVTQARTAGEQVPTQTAQENRRLQAIYGFSVYNPATGEAYIVEVVDADLGLPDQLPDPTVNTTYDPFYVRVVFLNTLTAYNMSIIVPAMARDQYLYLAKPDVEYDNLLAKTDDYSIGYMYQIADASDAFDEIDFVVSPLSAALAGPGYIYTNVPYRLRSDKISDASELFVCRRRNWDATCLLMAATHPRGKSVYLAFGGGDLVPMRLDAGVTVDERRPGHMVEFSYPVADKKYEAARTFSCANVPYFVGVTTYGGVVGYSAFSISGTEGVAGVSVNSNAPLKFPSDICVAGQATATLTSVTNLVGTNSNANATDTGAFANCDDTGKVIGQQFAVIPYNNLVYMIRAVSNVGTLGNLGGLGVTSGLLIDTYVPAANGTLTLAQAARYKQSGLPYFGSTYTATTMVDTLDQLDFTSVTGETFYAPTIFVPIPEIDTTTGFVADLADFLGQQVWTFIYPEIVASVGETVNGVPYPQGHNLDTDGKPILSLQKLHFVYDPLAVLFTPNDLTHKYPLQPKVQVLALTNSQIREGICWRSANLPDGELPPTNVCAQEILPEGIGMDRTNIVYSSHNRPVETSSSDTYLGMSVKSFISVSATVYSVEESAMQSDPVGAGFITQVSSTSNMLIGVLFDYDNDELGTLQPYDEHTSTKGLVFINGYQSASGYTFSSPDHFDVNDVLPSEVPQLDEIADILGLDVASYNIDVNLPRQFWSFSYDGFTAPGLPNYIADVPPAPVDPTFLNRTRSVLLSLRNPVRPTELGLIDTCSSVVSANLHLENGVTGSIFLVKQTERDIASLGSNPNVGPLAIPVKYDFFVFSRDHYATLHDCYFDLIDEGYAMCLLDDGTGTGTKVAQYYIDADGNYNELFTYVLYSQDYGILESSAFTLKVTLGSPANLNAVPPAPETPNSVNPTDLVAQINKVSNLVYAAFGPASPGQPAPYIPIQTSLGTGVQAAPILGPPGFNGYSIDVINATHQPVQISQIYSGTTAYQIAGSTTEIPLKSGKAIPFYGSISHGLDKMVTVPTLGSGTASLPRPTDPVGPTDGVLGGNGLGAMIGTPFSLAFQGSGAIPPAVADNPTPGTTMPADTAFYTYDPINLYAMDTTGKSVTAAGTQYFVDETDPANPVYVVIALPKFTFDVLNTGNVNLNTTLADGVTSRYTLVFGGRSYLFDSENQVNADRSSFTFNPVEGGIYTVTYGSLDTPVLTEFPSPITLTPFSMTAGGVTTAVDAFNNADWYKDISLGVLGRTYTYNAAQATVTVNAGAASTTVPIQTGVAFASNNFYGYVIDFTQDPSGTSGVYTVNGQPAFLYAASTTGAPASYPIMTAPEMFTINGNFYTFDQDDSGDYISVTGGGETIPIDPYQFSIDGTVYIFNTNVQPYTVVGGGNTYPMEASNTQFVINGVQYTVTLKAGSLNGATISGQYNITQANMVVIENYAYQLDVANGCIIGNGTTYPLTSSGFTYSISTADNSYTVTTAANATTVTIGGVVYQINDTTVVGDGITYPILTYRTFTDGDTTYQIGLDGTADLPQPITLAATTPPTFTDSSAYTVGALAAFDGSAYHVMSGAPPAFSAGGLTYTLRNDGASIAAGPAKTYIAQSSATLQPYQIPFGPETIYFGQPLDVAAFDGTNYYAITADTFTDTTTSEIFTIDDNFAVNTGNSYEIYSNLGTEAYFEVPGGKTYFVNVAVADSGSASGTIYDVFPISGSGFTIPLQYTLTVTDTTVSVDATTYTAATALTTLTATGSKLTGGSFTDAVTGITYTCVVDGDIVSFIDSNNVLYPFSTPGTSGSFTASVIVTTGVLLAVDSEATPAVYPVINNEFVVGVAPDTTTYTVNVSVAYADADAASGPYWPVVNGRFILPGSGEQSSIAYTVRAGAVIKGYVVSDDDQFSPDGNVVYTVNAVNIVKSTNQQTLSGSTLTAGSLSYTLGSPANFVSVEPTGVTYSTTTEGFTVSYNGTSVTYTVSGSTVADNRTPSNSWSLSVSGSESSFTDTTSGVTFSFDPSGDNPVTAEFPYENDFFVDPITGTTYFVDTTSSSVEAISYLPETTQSAFTPANGTTYLIDYSDVEVVFPVISGPYVNAGVATVGGDQFTVEISGVDATTSPTPIQTNQNSFSINGNLYTIAGTPSGADYSACSIVGDAKPARPFLSANTFSLGDPTVTYSLLLDADNLPETITAAFAVKASRTFISVNDNIYLITYSSLSTGSLLGQGQASIPIAASTFKLTNPFDTTVGKFTFDDLDIYDAGSVVGQFTAYESPTFFLNNDTYTLNTTALTVTDDNGQPYPLVANPTMFSIGGFNYLIDTNRTPHAIVGNDNVSPLSTDVTVQNGVPVANTTFTLNGQDYASVEDAQHRLLAVTGIKTYLVAQPALTFKLDSSLVFTIDESPPTSGDYAGTVVPIGRVTAGSIGPITSATTVLNLYAGTNESGGNDYFMYKNMLYTLIKSAGVYTAVQKTYTVYVSAPASTQQQLAVFDLGGTTYIVTDGSTAGTTTATGINPSTMWAQSAIASLEAQYGVVYGFAAAPTSVTQDTVTTASGTTTYFQFSVAGASGATTTYNILYTAGSTSNMVQVDVPDLLPSFTQSISFDFHVGTPLTLQTGGYNAFSATLTPAATLTQNFAGAFKTPLNSSDAAIDSLIGSQGDFTLEFWHSLTLTPVNGYHPFTYQSSTTTNELVYLIDVDFENSTSIYVKINDTVMAATTPAPAFSSRWRHFALTYDQPYTMLCKGAGYEVADGSNYNFTRDFSIAMTFAAGDVDSTQALVYKGTGSSKTPPELDTSYRLGLANGAVTLELFDGDGNPSKVFSGPPVEKNTYYQVIAVKHTTTPTTGTTGKLSTPSTDPYSVPSGLDDFNSASQTGGGAHFDSIPPHGGQIDITKVGLATPSTPTQLSNLMDNITKPKAQSFTVVISVRTVHSDGTFGNWVSQSNHQDVGDDANGLTVNSTGAAHLLIGDGFDDSAAHIPFGTSKGSGNIRDLYLFNSAIDPTGLRSHGTPIDLADASTEDLQQASIVGYWPVVYDANGVVNNPFDQNAAAVSTTAKDASLVPLTGHELEATTLYLNGYPMTLTLATDASVTSNMASYSKGWSELSFNAGEYRLEEISLWSMSRAQYQIQDDMFGRLVASSEPFLTVYLSAQFPPVDGLALPMNEYVDGLVFPNGGNGPALTFTPATLDLIGSPCVGRCGPLITPNLYTPPGVALTVCDTVPFLTSYSVTLNTTTSGQAGEINEAYVYLQDNVLMLYAGKKVGDLQLTWVSQEQGDVQMIGFVEGAPPAPMANLTNKSSYSGATSVTLSAPTSVSLKYQTDHASSNDVKASIGDNFGASFGIGWKLAPFGAGIGSSKKMVNLSFKGGTKVTEDSSNGSGDADEASIKIEQSSKYTVKLEGSMAPYTGDQFMANLNTVTMPTSTPGTPGAKTPILPNPNLGGFTTSNPPASLPHGSVTEEKFGERIFNPSPYGQAFVTSQTLDVYQATLVQSGTVYGFIAVPNAEIPRDLNIVSFRLNSQYIRPGVLDGMIGYAYNPATLPDGAQSYTTSTGEVGPLYDANFSQGLVGHDASYMQLVNAYQVKKQIDQEAYNTLALYSSAYQTEHEENDSLLALIDPLYQAAGNLPDPSLIPALDFYDEYVWSSRGATQEVKHTYTTTYQEVLTTNRASSTATSMTYNAKIGAAFLTVLDATTTADLTTKDTWKYTYTGAVTSSFDVTASFAGLESDTQMRYKANNDAHFVMNFNSMFNPNNQSGIELVVGSDGLVYQIVPSVQSGAGLPLSNNLDTSQGYTQPQPSYTTGNADGLTGNLEPYDRPGKTNLFRTYAFFLQPTTQNADDFWNTVIDTTWLNNSPDPDAEAMRSAQGNPSVPWRLFYRVTYSERFLPPVSVGSTAIPQITPIMAVPVLDPASNFIFTPMTSGTPRPASNPANDIQANVVLVTPTQSGLSVGTTATVGPLTGQPVPANNVIPFDFVKLTTPLVNWGDTNNAKVLGQLVTSVLGSNLVPMSPNPLPGSVLYAQVADPVDGGVLYTIYTDPNGITVNVPTNFEIDVYQDVNGNPIQYYDGKAYHSLQADYTPSPDGTIAYYIQPPSTYGQSNYDAYGDYDPYTNPGDEWRYFLVSGTSSDMTGQVTFEGEGPFFNSTGVSGFTGLTIAGSGHGSSGANQVQGYVLFQGVLQYPNLNTNAETFSDLLVYKAMSLLDTFPIGDPSTLIRFLEAQYPGAPFIGNDEMTLVFARNITSYLNTLQQALIPQ
jgi:hypothetical protein